MSGDEEGIYGAIGNTNKEGAVYSLKALSEGMDKFNVVLKGVANKYQIELIDLDHALPKDISAFYDYCHYNRSGMRQVAEIVKDSLNMAFLR